MIDDAARRALKDALNGELEGVPAPSRRGMLALATKIDENVERVTAFHIELMNEIESLKQSNVSLKRWLATFGSGVLLILVGTALRIIADSG